MIDTEWNAGDTLICQRRKSGPGVSVGCQVKLVLTGEK
jgi:hypothetical protein